MRAAELESLGASFRADVAARILSESSEAAGQDASRLKKTRIKNGLSQSALAKASGVPLRTIQQYEQRQKDINRAGAAYIIMLSSALNCDPASILERDLSASD
jgi:transcriptional regulator with XRE-family HTH domain